MNIIVAILLFGFIVFVHELGHFLFAKKAGVRVHEFAIGMGPKIFTTQKGETSYSIRALPIGGFVSMEGEDETSNDPRSLEQKTILQRASIMFAGPFFNIILTILLFIPVFFVMGVPSDSNVLGEIQKNSPAYEAGLKQGDKIVEIDNIKTDSWEEIVNTLSTKTDKKPVSIEVERDGNIKEYDITPQKGEDGRYVIGIVPQYEKSFLNAIISSFTVTIDMVKQMLVFLFQLVTGTLPGEAADSVAGPIGVLGIVSDAASTGIINVIYIGAVISLNLGVMNLLPIPALDGGRLFFLGIEAIRGKKMNPEKEIMINNIGFILLMAFMLFVTYKDIIRLF